MAEKSQGTILSTTFSITPISPVRARSALSTLCGALNGRLFTGVSLTLLLLRTAPSLLPTSTKRLYSANPRYKLCYSHIPQNGQYIKLPEYEGRKISHSWQKKSTKFPLKTTI